MPTVRGNEQRGVAFPITRGREGFWPRRGSMALRRTAIAMILGTARGERVGEPEFGADLHRFLFEPMTPTVVEQIRQHVIDALARWEPMADVISVLVEPLNDTVTIYVDFVDLGAATRERMRSAVRFRRG